MAEPNAHSDKVKQIAYDLERDHDEKRGENKQRKVVKHEPVPGSKL